MRDLSLLCNPQLPQAQVDALASATRPEVAALSTAPDAREGCAEEP